MIGVALCSFGCRVLRVACRVEQSKTEEPSSISLPSATALSLSSSLFHNDAQDHESVAAETLQCHRIWGVAGVGAASRCFRML